MPSDLARAGAWLLRSGIQLASGGVARHYRLDTGRNSPISTEITGYLASTFAYLHTLTGVPEFLDRAAAAARFLTETAWDPVARTVPFELEPPALTYFFDCGIVVRGLIAASQATGERQFLDTAVSIGDAMAADFTPIDGGYQPVLELPGKRPIEIDPLRWSRAPGCYQLKSAMAWFDLWEATGEPRFRDRYDRALESALPAAAGFLPGHPDREKVMDRLHAWLYFLEGLLPCTEDPRCAEALCSGIRRASQYLLEIAPLFERSDVYAQLLRMRFYAGPALDRDAAGREMETLRSFQRPDGGFYFGRKGASWLPHVSPVSTAFAIQALALWEGAVPDRRLLI